jgi:glycosyltransferase involved in cell wall biosynthesis
LKVTLLRGRAIDSAIYKIADTLSHNGHEVRLLVWDRMHTLQDTRKFDYEVVRFNLKAPYDKSTALFYIPIWMIYLFFFLLREKTDVIHASDLDTLIPAALARVIRKNRLYYTVYDFMANNLPDGRFQILRKLFRRFVAATEKWGIGLTDVLFLVDECRFENVKGAQIKKVVYIYNTPPDSLVTKPDGLPNTSSRLGLFYAGIINRDRGLEHWVRAVRGLDGVELTIAGSGPNLEFIKSEARHNKNVIFLGQIPYEEVISRTQKEDILFATYDPVIPTNKYASPNKLFEAMMCGKPIIVNDGTSMADIVKKENCGLIVGYGNVEQIRNAILRLKDDGQFRKELGEKGRKAYDRKYSWSIMEKRLLYEYQESLNNN